MSNIQIKRVGTNFKVSNGIVTLEGPNRAQLLHVMDILEASPAAAEKIQERVEKAAEAAQEKKNPETTKKVMVKKEAKVSGVQKVRDFMAQSKGKVTIAQVAEATGLSNKYAANYLWNLWNAGQLKSTEKGIYSK